MGRYRTSVLILLTVMLFSFPVYTQQFEGIIDIKLSTPSFDIDEGIESVVQRFYIKQPNVRIEVEGSMSDVVILVDNEKREMYVLDRSMKRYTSNTFEEYTDEEEQQLSIEFKMNRTGESKPVLGYRAEQIEFIALGDTRESFDRIEVWVTKELGTLFGDLLIGMTGNEGVQKSWQVLLIEQQYFPLKTRTFYENYLLEETEVVNIERRSLNRELFTIPPDYRHVDLRK